MYISGGTKITLLNQDFVEAFGLSSTEGVVSVGTCVPSSVEGLCVLGGKDVGMSSWFVEDACGSNGEVGISSTWGLVVVGVEGCLVLVASTTVLYSILVVYSDGAKILI